MYPRPQATWPSTQVSGSPVRRQTNQQYNRTPMPGADAAATAAASELTPGRDAPPSVLVRGRRNLAAAGIESQSGSQGAAVISRSGIDRKQPFGRVSPTSSP